MIRKTAKTITMKLTAPVHGDRITIRDLAQGDYFRIGSEHIYLYIGNTPTGNFEGVRNVNAINVRDGSKYNFAPDEFCILVEEIDITIRKESCYR